MNVSGTAFGIWSGGRFMHFGEPVGDERFFALVRQAYDRGLRTFMTADVYGSGEADTLLGQALAGIPRDTYCLIGMIGHDFYTGKREGAKGFPRFTDPRLRGPEQYEEYVRMAVEKSLARCHTQKFDLLLLHNPDSIGYSSEAVWQALNAVKEAGLTDRLGIAPGPANGFTLDILQCFEKFGAFIDWAMIILNPLEPWPGHLCLPAAEKHGVDIITRVVDYGGLFHDDVKPGHRFGPQDHRTFRPAGWVEAGNVKIEKMREVAARHGLTMLQLASLWNLAHPMVKSVVPTLIQELGGRPIEEKVEELARLPEITLTREEVEAIHSIGDNTGCMTLKGGNPQHEGEPLPDRWAVNEELAAIASRWNISPEHDLVPSHA
ncbi:MAG: aldo/keto reductase [Chthoniobacteraceae bacterium]